MGEDDLGGLGAVEGPPAVREWTPPSIMPLFLPWVAMLGLLMLRTNRSGQAWWIWAALVAVCGLGLGVPGLLEALPSEVQSILSEVVISMGFGLGALWLLAPSLNTRPRFLTLLGMFAVLAGFSIFAALTRVDLVEDGIEVLPKLIMLAMTALVIVLAMVLANRICRSQFHWVRVVLGWMMGLVVGWILVLAPWFVLVTAMSGGEVAWVEFFFGFIVCVGTVSVVMVPYLVLSLAHPFFGERLRGLMQPQPPSAPPVLESSAG